MFASMKQRLDKKKQGTYEKTNKLRYFGNEKFRKENYFGKQKLEVSVKFFLAKTWTLFITNSVHIVLVQMQVNVVRMTQKMRRAEIEERMDSGMSYEQAGELDIRRT